MAEAVTPRTRLVFLANPNNPTGTIFRRRAGRRSCARLPPRQLLVVVDEAYASTSRPRVSRHHRAARRRQRAGGDAAHLLEDLRAGGPAHRLRRRARAEIIEFMQPRAAAVQRATRWRRSAALAALDDVEHVQRTRAVQREGMRLRSRKRSRGLGLDSRAELRPTSSWCVSGGGARASTRRCCATASSCGR